MILGEVLDARVRSHDGEPLGHVVDVRFALELTEDEPERADDEGSPLAERTRRRDAVGRAELVGLLVSPRSTSSFLGFERTDVRSPYLIAALVRRRHRGAFLVPWEDVADVADGSVTLAEGFARLDPTL